MTGCTISCWPSSTLAADLDEESREQAFSLVSTDWWAERTAGLTGSSHSG